MLSKLNSCYLFSKALTKITWKTLAFSFRSTIRVFELGKKISMTSINAGTKLSRHLHLTSSKIVRVSFNRTIRFSKNSYKIGKSCTEEAFERLQILGQVLSAYFIEKKLKKQKFQNSEICQSKKKCYVLEEWLLLNIRNPYPKKNTKNELALKSNLSYKQVHNWFTYKRRKLKSNKSYSTNRISMENKLILLNFYLKTGCKPSKKQLMFLSKKTKIPLKKISNWFSKKRFLERNEIKTL